MAEIGLPTIPCRERSVASCAIRVFSQPDEYPHEIVSAKFLVVSMGDYVVKNGVVYDEGALPTAATIRLEVGSVLTSDVPTNPEDFEYNSPPANRWVASGNYFGYDDAAELVTWTPVVGSGILNISGDARFLDSGDSLPLFGYNTGDEWIAADALSMEPSTRAEMLLDNSTPTLLSIVLIGSFDKSSDVPYRIVSFHGTDFDTSIVIDESNRFTLVVDGMVKGTANNVLYPGQPCAVMLAIAGSTIIAYAVGPALASVVSYDVRWVDTSPVSVVISSGQDSDIELLEAALWTGPECIEDAAVSAVEAVSYYKSRTA